MTRLIAAVIVVLAVTAVGGQRKPTFSEIAAKHGLSKPDLPPADVLFAPKPTAKPEPAKPAVSQPPKVQPQPAQPQQQPPASQAGQQSAPNPRPQTQQPIQNPQTNSVNQQPQSQQPHTSSQNPNSQSQPQSPQNPNQPNVPNMPYGQNPNMAFPQMNPYQAYSPYGPNPYQPYGPYQPNPYQPYGQYPQPNPYMQYPYNPYQSQPNPYQPQPNPYQPQPNPYQPQPNPYQPQPNPYQPQPNPYQPQPNPYQPIGQNPQPNPYQPQPNPIGQNPQPNPYQPIGGQNPQPNPYQPQPNPIGQNPQPNPYQPIGGQNPQPNPYQPIPQNPEPQPITQNPQPQPNPQPKPAQTEQQVLSPPPATQPKPTSEEYQQLGQNGQSQVPNHSTSPAKYRPGCSLSCMQYVDPVCGINEDGTTEEFYNECAFRVEAECNMYSTLIDAVKGTCKAFAESYNKEQQGSQPPPMGQQSPPPRQPEVRPTEKPTKKTRTPSGCEYECRQEIDPICAVRTDGVDKTFMNACEFQGFMKCTPEVAQHILHAMHGDCRDIPASLKMPQRPQQQRPTEEEPIHEEQEECEPMMCPQMFDPVCGISDDGSTRQFGNQCGYDNHVRCNPRSFSRSVKGECSRSPGVEPSETKQPINDGQEKCEPMMCPQMFDPVCGISDDGSTKQFANQCGYENHVRCYPRSFSRSVKGGCSRPAAEPIEPKEPIQEEQEECEPMMCPQMFDPVCGISEDGSTRQFGNQCGFNNHVRCNPRSFSRSVKGECPAVDETQDLGDY